MKRVFLMNSDPNTVTVAVGDQQDCRRFVHFVSGFPDVNHVWWERTLNQSSFKLYVCIKFSPSPDLSTYTHKELRAKLYLAMFRNQRAQTYDAFRDVRDTNSLANQES